MDKTCQIVINLFFAPDINVNEFMNIAVQLYFFTFTFLSIDICGYYE